MQLRIVFVNTERAIKRLSATASFNTYQEGTVMEKRKLRYLILCVPFVCAMICLPLSASAEMKSITGKMIGFTCFVQGYTCPIDKKDPMLAIEKDFVLVTPEGNHYFLTNLGLGLKATHALETVTATGDVNEKYKSMKVNKFEVDGEVVWSQKMQDEMLDELGMDR